MDGVLPLSNFSSAATLAPVAVVGVESCSSVPASISFSTASAFFRAFAISSLLRASCPLGVYNRHVCRVVSCYTSRVAGQPAIFQYVLEQSQIVMTYWSSSASGVLKSSDRP